MYGTIQSYSDIRGFGFILIEGKHRRFFHIRNFQGPRVGISPYVGMRVSFDLAPSSDPRQPDQAINVRPVPAGTGIRAVSK